MLTGLRQLESLQHSHPNSLCYHSQPLGWVVTRENRGRQEQRCTFHRATASSSSGPTDKPSTSPSSTRISRQYHRNGWIGSACHLQRRPTPPSIVKQADREVEPIQQQAARLGNGKPQQQDRGSSSVPYDRTDFVAETLLPTKTGRYRLRGYRHSVDGGRTYTEPTCIMTGSPEGCERVPVRVHDACFTSEVLGSLKCDCAEQLQLAMDYIQASEPGIIIYLQQEGRGIGLANKIAAYSLQERGLDTVDANRALGLPDDCREYTSVRNILQDLGIKSIRLMTNNPRKIAVLREMGVIVTDRIPCIVKAQQFSQGYLATKQERMMHELDGSYCFWNHDGEPTGPLMSMDAPVAADAASVIADKAEHSSQGSSS